MKHIFPRQAGALILALALVLSLAPAALAEDAYTIDPAAWDLQVGQTAELSARMNNGPLPSGISVSWEGTAAVSIQEDYGSIAAIRADAPTPDGEPARVRAVFTRDGETLGEAVCSVTVRPAAVTDVTLNKTQLTLAVGGREQLTATVLPASAANKSVTWTSSDTSVAVVTNDGTVIARGAGTSNITVATADGGYTETCVLEVKEAVPVASVRIEPVAPVVQTMQGKALTLERDGQRETLALTVMPTDATDKSVEWASGDEKVVTVNGDGQVTAVSPGTAVVTVSSRADPNKVDSCEVTVSGITVSETSVELKVGQSVPVVATAYGRASGRLVWTSDDPTVASGDNNKIVGVSIGTTTVRVAAPGTNYEKSIAVTVAENTVRFDSSVSAGDVLYFSGLLSRFNEASREGTTGKAGLKSITNVSVATREGIIHYGYLSPDVPNHGVGGSEVYYVSPDAGRGEQSISDLKFVPASGFSGTAVITYEGRSTKDEIFNGTIYVAVENSGDVMYSTAMDRPLTLSAKEFRDVCKLKTGRNASFVTFSQPADRRGTLYYNYSPGQYSQKVDNTTRYYVASRPLLEEVTFVPADHYTGTVSVPYRCTDTTGGSYSGTMTINVYAADGDGGAGGVEYTTGVGQRVTLNAADFNAACQDANDRTLSYIYFDELPPASQGILYYSYTSSSSSRVDTSTRYYRSGTGSRISSITFVPAGSFSGTVTVPYTGYDTQGVSYKDELVIHVSDAAGAVSYSTDAGEPVTFRAEDFNDACRRANGATLNYVTFTQPSSSVGTLYRDYRNSSNTGTRISSSQRFSRGGSSSVSDVTFVPRSGYEGTVSIPFSGYDDAGSRFEGTVSITVGRAADRVVRYSVSRGGVVRFDSGDFNTASRAATGENLSYVSFDLPASRYGTLYYQYNTARGTGTPVSSSASYYRSGSGRLLDDVSFAAASSINGTVSFDYTARSTGGSRFTGTVEIAVGNTADSGNSSGTRYIGSSTPVALRTADFQAACPGTLSYIRFSSLPSESTGRLYMGYVSPSHPGAPATTTANYTAGGGLSIGQLSFVPKAGYQGQVNIPYVGYDTQGGTFSGNVTIDLYNSYCATPFYDVDSGWDWARPSVEFLRYAGISNGYSDGSFRPSRSISRGEFTLMVCRAFGFDTSARVSSFPDVPADSPYAGAVAAARSMGIVEGSGGRFNPTSPITRQSAMTMICRAMRFAGKRVPATTSSALSAFVDQTQISSYARDSVAALVQLGVVQGNANMRIDPRRSISRAEMAVILHRVLTL